MGYANPGGTTTDSWTWNAFSGKFSASPILIGEDVFCCGVSQLPDGRPIISGGNMNVGFGITHSFIFNPSSGTWTQSGHLNDPRWYPTLAMLSDGTLTAVSGWSEPDNEFTRPIETDWVERIDLFNVSTETWADFMPTYDLGGPEDMQPHFYPFMIPYYDATAPTTRKLFFAGRATAAGYAVPYSYNTYRLEFSSNNAAVWKPHGGDSEMQGSGAVVMIGGTDPIDAGTVFKFGGVVDSQVVGWGRKLNLNSANPGWTATTVMPTSPDQKRAECNVVAMPDGRIALVGGTTATVYHSQANTGVNNIIIYNPVSDAYDEISDDFSGTRMYHSTALFSPTGTIFMAGGEYLQNQHPHQHASNYTAQEYYPTYFEIDAEARPVITASPTTANWNTTIQVTVTGPVDHFSLLKLSSTTHANDTTQRYIKLTEASRSGNNYQLKMPKNGGVAPPGYYMLFALNNYGVPSVAKYVKIGS